MNLTNFRFAFITLLLSISGCAFLSLSGCASQEGISSNKQLQDPSNLTFNHNSSEINTPGIGGDWPNRHWWEEFNDPQLNQLITDALQHSPTLAEATARIQLAEARLGGAESVRYPSLHLDTEITRKHYSENGLTPAPLAGSARTSGDISLRANYQLDFWGRNRATIAASRSRREAVAAEAASTQLLLTTAIAHAYFTLAQWQELQKIAQTALVQRQQILDLTQQRVDAGLDNRVELKLAETQLALTLTAIAQVEEATINSQHTISALLGMGPDNNLDLHASLPVYSLGQLQLPSDLTLGLLGRRPDLVASRWQVEATLRDIDASKAAFYPDINLLAFAGFSSIGLDKLLNSGSKTFGAGPALTLPIFDGQRLRSELRADVASYDQAVAIYNQSLIDALHDLADQLTSYRLLTPQLFHVKQALDTAQEAHTLAMDRYRAGVGNYLTVLNTETSLIEQQIFHTQLELRALDSRVNLYRALGGGFTAEIPPTETNENQDSLAPAIALEHPGDSHD